MGSTGEITHGNLTKDSLLSMLKAYEKTDDVVLLDHTLTPGSQVGDNYSGIVVACKMKAKIKGKDEDVHWIFKLVPEGKESAANRLNWVRLMHVEEKEVDMYTRIIPAFKELIKDKKADIELNFAEIKFAEVIKDDNGKVINSNLAMANLKVLGYDEPFNKKKGLNVFYAKLALEEIAKFHALGYVYLKSFGSIEKGLEKEPLLTRDYFVGSPDAEMVKLMEPFKDKTVNDFCKLLEVVQEPGQDFAGALRACHEKEHVMDQRDALCRPNPKEFNTFCHGDSWFNNMLFLHDKDQKPVKCTLIDLAMTKWANPCTDLAYFLFLSTTPQLRRTHMDELLGHYHDTFIRCLSKLGEDPAIYPYRQLVKDYKKYKFFGLTMALWALPLMLCKKEDALDPAIFDDVDWTDPAQAKATMDKADAIMQNAYRNEPQIKIVLGGCFQELLEDGFFQLPN